MSRSPTSMFIPRATWRRCWDALRDQGKTIFVVTHQAALMEGVADEFVHMSAGQIVRAKNVAPRSVAAAQATGGAARPR